MLKVYTFGKPTTYVDNEPLVVFRTRKAEAILYYLVVASKPVDRTELAELFWPEMTTSSAQKNLRATLPDLREMLGDYLSVNNQTISIATELEHWVDLYELRQLLAEPIPTAAAGFSQCMQLFQGELLNGLAVSNAPEFDSWLTQQRESFQNLIVDALEQWSEQFAAQGAIDHGLEATQRWLQLQPWNETAHRLRMKLFWHNKERGAALLQYTQCFKYLEEELGVEPSSETKHLYAKIQSNELPAPFDGPSLVQQSNRVQQGDRVQPRAIKHNLLSKFTSFIGREEEIETLLHYLLEQKHSLISIVGEGGVGKTRLAVAVAEKLVSGAVQTPYHDGIWFISCAGIDDGPTTQEQLAINISTAIGVQFQGTKSLIDQLIDYLANKSLLLIIDNFEHLAEHVQLFLSLVQQSRKLQLLITSRHQLNVQCDICLRLDGLAIPSLTAYATDEVLQPEELSLILRSPSVQILSDRAEKVLPGFVIDEHNGTMAGRLCQLLNGNPLALELAATLTLHYDLGTLFHELMQNYLLLTSDLQDLPIHQRSIYNTIDYSWRLLSPSLAKLMAQCSVFRGIFNYHAATTITHESPRTLTQLVYRSLLHTDEQRHIQIHEMVRQFAAQKLAQNPDLQMATYRQHSEYYIGLLVQWWESTSSQHIVAHLLPHLDNLYAAWEWAFNHRVFGLLSRAIIPFTQFHIYTGLIWDVHILINSYSQKLQTIQDSDAKNSDAASADAASTNAANAATDQAQELRTALTYASAVFNHHLGNYEQATELMLTAQKEVSQFGYLYLAANIEHYLANFHRLAQRLQEAQEHFSQAIRYAQDQQQPYSGISPLLYLASLAIQRGYPDEGETYLKHAYSLLQEYPDVTIATSYHSILGTLQHAQGRWSEALVTFQRMIAISSQQRKPIHEYHNVGKILWQSGCFEKAKEYLEQVDSTDRNFFYRPGTYWHTVWLIDFANLYAAWEQPEQALFYAQMARGYAQKQQAKVLLGRSLKAEGAARLQLQQWVAAKESLLQALLLFREESALDHECTVLTQLIQHAHALAEKTQLATYAESLWNLLHSGLLDMTNAEPIKAWWHCYMAFRALGDIRAEDALNQAQSIFQTQLAYIHDESWRQDFSTHIPEHRLLQQAKEKDPIAQR